MIFCIIWEFAIQKKLVIFSTDKIISLAKNIIKIYGVCDMENNEKNNPEFRMEAASDIRADIKKDFDERIKKLKTATLKKCF